jgi:cell division protein FtsZ
MDEEDTIMSYLREQAGEDADVIKGIGFDETLGNKIGVTIIATGFEHKDPFKPQPVIKNERKEEKIVMALGVPGEEKKLYTQPALALEDKDPFAPTMSEMPGASTAPFVSQPQASVQSQTPQSPYMSREEEQAPQEPVKLHFELKPEITEPVQQTYPQTAQQKGQEELKNTFVQPANENTARTNSSFLARPSNIYADPNQEFKQKNPVEAQPSMPPVSEQPELEMKLVMKDESPEAADEVRQPQPLVNQSVEDPTMQDDADDQKRRAAERIQKLRNLSFNMNAADPNNEFEAVPAYIRRNMEMFGNTLTSVESFYSKYTVKPDEDNKGQISSINTFLDGKKPD